MATSNQAEFFGKLLTEKQLPEGQDPAALKVKFAELSTKSASAWIERLMELPDVGADTSEVEAPPF